jgi:hypothetical protein
VTFIPTRLVILLKGEMGKYRLLAGYKYRIRDKTPFGIRKSDVCIKRLFYPARFGRFEHAKQFSYNDPI